MLIMPGPSEAEEEQLDHQLLDGLSRGALRMRDLMPNLLDKSSSLPYRHRFGGSKVLQQAKKSLRA